MRLSPLVAVLLGVLAAAATGVVSAAPCVCLEPAPCQFHDSVTCAAAVGGQCSPGSTLCVGAPVPPENVAAEFRSGYPVIQHAATTTVDVLVVTSAPAWCFGVVLPASAPAPTAAQVHDASAAAVAAHFSVPVGAADATAGVSVTGLEEDTQYTMYVVLQSTTGALLDETLVVLPVDTMADPPTWLHDYPHVTASTAHDFVVSAALSKAGTKVHVVAVAADAAPPSADDVVAGTGAGGESALGVASHVMSGALEVEEWALGLYLPSNMGIRLFFVGVKDGIMTQHMRSRHVFTAVDAEPQTMAPGYPSVAAVEGDSVTVAVAASERGVVHVLIVQGAPPGGITPGEVLAAAGTALYTSVDVAGAAVTATVSGLRYGEASTAYCLAVDDAGNAAVSVASVEFTSGRDPASGTVTLSVADVASTSATAVVVGSHSVAVSVLVLPATQPPPGAIAIRAHGGAQNHVLAPPTSAADAYSTPVFSATAVWQGLVPHTAYVVYAVAEDHDGVDEPVALVTFTTLEVVVVPPQWVQPSPTVVPGVRSATIALHAEMPVAAGVVVLPTAWPATPTTPAEVWSSPHVTVVTVDTPAGVGPGFVASTAVLSLSPLTHYTAFVAAQSLGGVPNGDVTVRQFTTQRAPAAVLTLEDVSEASVSAHVALVGTIVEPIHVAFAVVVGTLAAHPSATAIATGSLPRAVGDGIVAPVAGVASVHVPGLSPSTQYTLYAVGVVPGSGTNATVLVHAGFTTPVDTTPPLWLAGLPRLLDVDTTGVLLSVGLQEPGTVFAVAQAQSVDAIPTVQGVIDAATESGMVAPASVSSPAARWSGHWDVEGGVATSHWLRGLPVGTAMQLQIVARDTAGVAVASPAALEFMTKNDTTPPSFVDGFPTEFPAAATASSVAVEVVVAEACRAHWVLLLGDTRPAHISSSLVVAGAAPPGYTVVDAGSVELAASTGVIIVVGDELQAQSVAYVAIVLEDGVGNVQEVAAVVSATTGPDVDPPVWLDASPNITHGNATTWPRLELALDEPANVFVMVVAAGSQVPSTSQVFNMTCAACSIAATTVVAVANANEIVSTELSTFGVVADAYTVYVVAQDGRTPPNPQASAIELPLPRPHPSLLASRSPPTPGAGQEAAADTPGMEVFRNPLHVWGGIAAVVVVFGLCALLVVGKRRGSGHGESTDVGVVTTATPGGARTALAKSKFRSKTDRMKLFVGDQHCVSASSMASQPLTSTSSFGSLGRLLTTVLYRSSSSGTLSDATASGATTPMGSTHSEYKFGADAMATPLASPVLPEPAAPSPGQRSRVSPSFFGSRKTTRSTGSAARRRAVMEAARGDSSSDDDDDSSSTDDGGGGVGGWSSGRGDVGMDAISEVTEESTVSSPSAGSGTRASRRPTTASRRRSNSSSSDSSSSDSDNGSGTGSGAALPPAGRQRSPRRVTRARRGRGTATTPTAGLELRLPSSSGSDDEAFGVPSSRSSSNRVTPRRGNNRHAESGGHGGRNSLHSTLSSHSLPPGAVNVDDVVAPVNTERATDTGLVAATAELTANPLASQSGRRSGRRSRRRLVAERRHT